MKLPILNEKKQRQGERALPAQFAEPVRTDLIARAVRALQAGRRQPYGADPRAGKRASAELSRRRRKYRGSYGAGISRVPRKILSRQGTRMYWVGAFAPGTVGGRRAHPPKATKRWVQRLNTRERRKAIRSALAATVQRVLVEQRGHHLPEQYPFILAASFERLAKTRDVEAALRALGFDEELARGAQTKVRAGRGKMRGRRLKRPTSILLVVGEKSAPALRAAGNVAGLTVVHVRALNAELLAPGTHAGRVTLFTESALKIMEEEQLFQDPGKKPLRSPTARAASTKSTPKPGEATGKGARERAAPDAVKPSAKKSAASDAPEKKAPAAQKPAGPTEDGEKPTSTPEAAA